MPIGTTNTSFSRSPSSINMLFIAAFIVGVASAARLDSGYLPPGNSRSGGDENHLLAPTSPNGQDAVDAQQYYGAANDHNTQFKANINVADAGQYAAPNHHNGQSVDRHSSNHRFAPAAEQINILRSNSENNGDGSYNFEFETENKIRQQEAGQLKNAGSQDESISVQGSYSYVGSDGQVYTVNYVADENGFQPTGEHIHKAVQMAAADAARSAVNGASSAGYPSRGEYSNGVRASGQTAQASGYKY